MDTIILLAIALTLIAVVGLGLMIFFMFKKSGTEQLPDIVNRAVADQVTQLVQMSREEIGAQKEEIRKDAQEREESFRKVVGDIRGELAEHHKKIIAVEKERIGQFKELTTVMDEYKVMSAGLKGSTDDLKNLLSNNQLRGKFGEEVAENLLKSVGFVRGQYTVNESMETSNKRPDLTINLPDGTKVNVDVKFPFSALVKYQEADDETEKKMHLRQFTSDVKEKVKQVMSRDYINPEENTVDFVILFVPNEMIFSFIYSNLQDVWSYAMKNKVIMAGPFSFTAILRMIFQSYQNFTYQENLFDIIKLIKVFETEYKKFSDSLDKLGNQLETVTKQYQQVSVTRTRKLTGIVDRILHEEIQPGEDDTKKLDAGSE